MIKSFKFAKSTTMTTDEKYMYRALQLAKSGLPLAMPNPCVGAVIVHKDTIIGEGYTSPYGGPHAEVNAINSVQAEELLPESTLYVTLEPCSHYGKTPPCSLFIIEKKIKKVVIGCIDPYSEVSGRGIAQLKSNHIEVTVGVLEKACKASNSRFFTYHLEKRPYVILKWAASADGFIAPLARKEQQPVWLSNTYSRQLVHKWRSEEQAILVGTTTVLTDNPGLTTRDWYGRNPVRMYIDRNHKINNKFSITHQDAKIICLTETFPVFPLPHIHYECIDFSKSLPKQLLHMAYKHQIQSVIIEGGTQTLQQFIDENLWDEARIFRSEHILKEGIKAPVINHFSTRKEEQIASDSLTFLTRT